MEQCLKSSLLNKVDICLLSARHHTYVKYWPGEKVLDRQNTTSQWTSDRLLILTLRSLCGHISVICGTSCLYAGCILRHQTLSGFSVS